MKETTMNYSRGNNLISIQESLNKTITTTHNINVVPTVARNDVNVVMEESNEFYHTIAQKELSALFRGMHDNVDDFIVTNYEIISKFLVKKLCYTFYITKGGRAIYPNYSSLISIVKSGYNDLFFDDIKQEVALYLLESSDKISKDDNGCYTLEQLYIPLFKMVRNYLYNNKKKLDNTNVAIIGYNEDNEECESVAVNSASYNTWLMLNNKDVINDISNDFNRTVFEVLQIIRLTEKPKIYDGCCGVLELLLRGYKKKEIYKILDISKPTCTKYHNIIKTTFENLYKQPRKVTTATTKKHFNQKGHNYFNIDFSNCHIVNNNNDILCDKVNRYYHDKKQVMYNALFNAITKEVYTRINNNLYMYRKEYYLDTKF